MYRIIDHTADIGIDVKGSSLEELFVFSAEATFDLMVESKKKLIPSIEVPVRIEAPSVDVLLVRWLQELLFVFERRRLVLMRFFIDSVSEKALSGAAKGLPFDPTRHRQKMAIKAVTYHNLEVQRGEGGLWQARIIFDI